MRGEVSQPKTPAEISALYQELILDHYRRPRNKGTLENADASVEMKNPLCGDEINLQVAFDGASVSDLKFSGRGCSISQASADMMADVVKGQALESASELADSFKSMMAQTDDGSSDSLGDLAALQHVKRYPVRVKCALLPWNTLAEAIRSYESDRASVTR